MNSTFNTSSKFSTFDSFYASAPTSPRLLFSKNPNSNPNMCFYSIPNSPDRQFLKSSCCCDTTSATHESTFSDKNSNVEEFEFATSRSFDGDELETSDCFNGHGVETNGGGFDAEGVKIDDNFDADELETSDHFNGDGIETSGGVEEVKTCDLLNADELETSDHFNDDGFETSSCGFDAEDVKTCDNFNADKLETNDRFHSDSSETSDDFDFNADELEANDHFNSDRFETNGGFDADEGETSDLFNTDEELNFNEMMEKKRLRRRRYHESLPAMAFADELFSDGKMMPLNPPPMYSSCNNSPSPVNPNARFKIPFTKSLWNDDFDPFMVALEAVKEEKKEGTHRRTRSMLPLPTCTSFDPEEMHEHCLHSNPLLASPNRLKEPIGPLVDHNGPRKSPIRLVEPKGVMFARRARMVKLGYNYEKPISIATQEPNVIEEDSLSGRRRRRNTWQKMLSFHLRRAREEKNEKDLNVEFARSKLRKLSFGSRKLIHSHEEKKEMQVTKMTLVRYRPTLLLCLGYGAELG